MLEVLIFPLLVMVLLLLLLVFGAIGQGFNDGQRIGNSLYARGIYMNLALQNANATLEYYNNVRCIVFQPRKSMATNIQPTSVATFVQSVLSGQASSITQWAGMVDTDRFRYCMISSGIFHLFLKMVQVLLLSLLLVLSVSLLR